MIILLLRLFPTVLPQLPPPHRSFGRGAKTANSDNRKEVTNGITQGPKLDSPETAAERKSCASTQRSGSLIWATSSQPQSLRESKLEPSGDLVRKAPRTPLLQKTSSTITLQAAKAPLEPTAPVSGALSPFREEREGPAAPPPATLPARQPGLGSQEAVSKVGTGKFPMESRRESAFPKFESKPQSQEVSEGQTVKFRCEGE